MINLGKPVNKLFAVAAFGVLIFGAAAYFDFGPFLEILLSLPLVGGLSGAVFVILRDQLQQERNIDIQYRQHVFGLAASSHMANHVFDKHMEFCEKYIDKLYEIEAHLIAQVANGEEVRLANELFSLRRNYSAWLTDEIDNKLSPFEKNLEK